MEGQPQGYAVNKNTKLVYHNSKQVVWHNSQWRTTDRHYPLQECLDISAEYRRKYKLLARDDEIPEEPADTPEPIPEPHSLVDFTTPRPTQAEIIDKSKSEEEQSHNSDSGTEPEVAPTAPEPEDDTSEEPDMAEEQLAPAARAMEMKLKMPPEFEGKRGEVIEWLQKCSLYLVINQAAYDTDEKKIIFCLMLMNGGTAGAWAQSFLEDIEAQRAAQPHHEGQPEPAPNFGTWAAFTTQLKESFDDVNYKASARVLL
ncbi:hypothetical protein GY45DRAFT_1375848 [Cubamyces sp. BRFM 1775]|nr:hypothetical protein GY45DRAFT_1375848 [Cubamyces sp. BRFM 1775]